MYLNAKPVPEAEMATKVTEAAREQEGKVVFIKADEEAPTAP